MHSSILVSCFGHSILFTILLPNLTPLPFPSFILSFLPLFSFFFTSSSILVLLSFLSFLLSLHHPQFLSFFPSFLPSFLLSYLPFSSFLFFSLYPFLKTPFFLSISSILLYNNKTIHTIARSVLISCCILTIQLICAW